MRISQWQTTAEKWSEDFNAGEKKLDQSISIETDSFLPDYDSITNDPHFPRFFSLNEQYPNANLYFINWKVTESVGSIHKLMLNWSNTLPPLDLKGRGNGLVWMPHPVQRPAFVRRTTWRKTERVEVDLGDGTQSNPPKSVATTAGEKLYTSWDYAYMMYEVAKNLATPYSLPLAAVSGEQKADRKSAYTGLGSVDFTNMDVVIVRGQKCEPGTLWATDFLEDTIEIQNKVPYYPFSFRMRYNPKKWRIKHLNAGYRCNVKMTKVSIAANPSDIGTDNDTTVEIEDWDGKEESLPKRPDGFPGIVQSHRWISKEIVLGDPPSYPSEPVPLNLDGQVFRNSRSEVITSERGGLKEDQLEYLEFHPLQPINFNIAFPFLRNAI